MVKTTSGWEDVGIMEYWNTGTMISVKNSIFPLFHHSMFNELLLSI
jgi:hypothetical protein